MTPTAIRAHIQRAAPDPARFSLVVMRQHLADIDATAARMDGRREVTLTTPTGFLVTDPNNLRPGD